MLGHTLSALSLGTVAAFAVIRLADRFGRRPLLLVSLGGYALLTLATFFSRSLVEFAVLQFGARMLMVTQLALAYVILSTSALNIPFNGGVLVPDPSSPAGLFRGFVTDGAGNVNLSVTWPAGIQSGLTFYSQAWIIDAAGLYGVSASNAISQTTP